MVNSVEETEALETENINKEPEGGKSKNFFNAWQPGCNSRWVIRFWWSFFRNFWKWTIFCSTRSNPFNGFLTITYGLLDAKTV